MVKNNLSQSKTSANGEWLSALDDKQIRALASQRKVTGWGHRALVELIGELLQFDDIQEPVRG